MPAGHAHAQVATGDADTTIVLADPGDVLGSARASQARFERLRIRHLPMTHEPFGGSCDEVIGRFCTTYSEDEWYPLPEDEAIVRMRRELVAELDSLQRLAPDDEWIMGQRVWYRVEAREWSAALRTARACGMERWWCAALEGFVLHGLGRYADAAPVFERALDDMDPELARRWRVPRRPVDSDVRELLESAATDPDSERRLLDRLWWLADPLYLVDGNDRLTEHYARWTVARLRERARTPFRLSWGSDLEELTVRHGWEMGWERRPTRDFTSLDHIVGHKHPEGRDFMPPARALEAPDTATAEDLRADRRRPRSLYAPAYAPVLLPMEGQLAVFPRGARTVIVATHYLPADTTLHATHSHPIPWLEPGDQADAPDRAGLFAMAVEDGRLHRAERVGGGAGGAEGAEGSEGEGAEGAEGASLLDVPTGPYVVSSEAWSPSARRAGRLRKGVPARPAPEDVATLSDILLLEHVDAQPSSLEAAVPLALPRARIRAGETFAIGWEVAGLGFRDETLEFEVSVERTDRGVFRRIGEFLRLADRPQPLALTWQEPGPTEPRHLFRYLSLDLPALEEGAYEIRLVLRTAGRSDAVTIGDLEVVRNGRVDP